jgi:anti-anti-sigma regulatory factor
VLQLLLRDVRNQSGAIRLAGVQPLVRGTLDLVGLGPVFTNFDSVEAALLSFR